MIWIWVDYLCLAYVLIFGSIGAYTHDMGYIIASVMGLWAFAAITAMTKWTKHEYEMKEMTMQHEIEMNDIHCGEHE